MFDLLRNIEFDQPWLLLLLALLPLMIYYQYVYQNKSPVAAIRVGHTSSKLKNKSIRVHALKYMPLLQLTSLAFLIIAWARPQLALKEESIIAEGIDIILALDLSSSMLAKDFQPDRLEVSKKVASEFVDKRRDDRIGLVVFSGESFTQCPLTSDHRIVKRFLSQLQCGFLEEGTAIGMGLATAVNRIKDSDAKSKVVILLTDGDNNTGYIRPLTAAEMARELDVTVYTIGVGSKGMALTPQGKRSDGSYVFDYARVMINEELLNQIAQITGGQYFRATSEESLGMVYNEIDQLEKTEREVSTFKRYSDEFPWFLRIGLVLFVLHVVLGLTFLRTFP